MTGMLRTGCLLAVFLLAGCAGTTRTPDPGRALAPLPADGRRVELLRQADALVGVPYRYGGADRRGFDCSGLVQYVHRSVGLSLPRTAAAQWRQARKLPVERARAGDLLYFRIDDGKGDHVAIYAGQGRFIHAPSGGKRVSWSSLDNPYWRAQLVGAGSYL